MAHWKTYLDKEFIGAFDLQGRDIVVEIESVSGGEITGEGGKKSKKPVAKLKGKEKKLALNATMCRTLAALFGSNETNDWAGKRITLFPSMTQFGGKDVECIRIRPTLPKDEKPSKSDEKAAS